MTNKREIYTRIIVIIARIIWLSSVEGFTTNS